ncbi:MAG: hypothetical protein GEV28_05465 [Actinophytocola sp.]|uniref:hypothetical protein n=1 Tax=Actinophytocola sp. TaxID=1872138 RepID=UPI00132164C6|nr:hypothetical protein [Actinophytocola sp.]MPZ79862.1 hypothetical protein [Actinophytocola sp.]
MDTDPSSNVVVFQLRRGRDEHAAASAPTIADDCVRRAWDSARYRHHARPEDVVALHSEWEPSIADSFFIETTFPNAAVYYTFPRPDPDRWAEAFAAARDQLEAVATQGFAERAEQVERDGELLPMLWSASSPQFDLLETMPHRAVVPGRLYVSLAMVGPTRGGGLGVSHMTHHQLSPAGAFPGTFDDLFETARTTLTTGLRMEGYDNGVIDMHRDGSLAAPVVCLPDFHEQLAPLVGEDRFVAAIPCPQHVIVAAASSPHVRTIRSMVMESDYPSSEMIPCLLGVDRHGVSIVAERR